MGDIMLTGFSDEISPDFSEQLSCVKSLGVNNIEIRGVDGKNISELTEAEIISVKEKLDNMRIGISAIGSPIGKISVEEDFEPHFELFKKIVSFAKLLGTKYIRIFSFYIPKGEAAEKYRMMVIQRLRILIAYAVEQDVVLLHENEKGIYGDIAERCLELMKPLYCSSFGAVFDFANFIECGQDTLQAYELLKDYIKYVHIKDCKKDSKEIVPAGHGDGKVEEILVFLKDSGYKGYLSLEPHLTNFTGLSELENGGNADKAATDGFKAWSYALEALKAVLKRIGWE